MSRRDLLRTSWESGLAESRSTTAMADLDELAARNETGQTDTVLDALVVSLAQIFGSYALPITRDTVRAALLGANLLNGGHANVAMFAVLYQLNLEPDSEVRP